ncbi:MAG TPA: 2-dehydro-3-deoxy-6-phosphogalactonate aldolase [Ideonella sp.]|uniref:2-dehydro-3-deoxy-6-phosphogalactonate aldolase n=1 Tax=Ideonella sp. TaxID=1929293 RepID=UPI002BC71848|nr:2-dehydro-3-deoxy-6-phosphogalactonate aldolase [Ideonella sp.]HSI51020.1 2-dehydro-3-deoxy-6-phosphogalactonate aldolase [Ideonella sp.]
MNTNDAAWPPTPPLVAILRGLQPERATAVGQVLFDAGFRALEVPLNRPGALEAISLLQAMKPAGSCVGAGTVTSVAQVEAVAATGARLMVSPHFDAAVVTRAVELGCYSVPGIFTASEAYAALRAGAHALKIFPAEAMPPAGLQAIASILPPGTALWPVGGITPESLAGWRKAGANGFGIGGALFKPDTSLDAIAASAKAFIEAWAR